MKNLKKVLIIFIILYLAICQISDRTYAYLWSEVEKMIEFKEYEQDEEPKEKYDLTIDASQMVDNERLPNIRTSIDTVLYEDNDLLDVNFFDNDSKNKNESWIFINNLVKTVFRISLYISAAALLTLLLYIALVIVSSSISKGTNILPFGKEMYNNKNKLFSIGISDPKKNLREKILIEQWIASALILASIVPLFTVITGFSKVVGDATNRYNSKKDADETIGIFVKNARRQVSNGTGSSLGTSSSTQGSTNLEADIENYINNTATSGDWEVYAKNLTSDTLAVNIHSASKRPSASVIKLFIAATYYEKFGVDKEYESTVRSMINASSNSAANELIAAVNGFSAVNDYASRNGYSSTALNREFDVTSYSEINDNYTSAEDVGKLLENIYNGTCVSQAASEKILTYMKEQKNTNKIPAGVSGVTVANKTGELPSSSYVNGPVENDAAIVYKDGATYILVIMSSNVGDDSTSISNIVEISKKVFEGIGGAVSGNGSSTKIEYFNYFFKTNLEGLLMFQSQYKWEEYGGINWQNIIGGMFLTGFKIILYYLFVGRMFIIAFLIAFSPLAVLLNGFMRVIGNKGILMGWIKIYLYTMLVKPAIAAIYYVLAKTNVYRVVENPLYILVVIAIIIVLISITFKKLIESISTGNKNSKIKSKTKK